MEDILWGIPNACVRVDDILLAWKTCAEHLQTLQDVLQRLKDTGARLKKRKCVFLAPEVVYLGLKIDKWYSSCAGESQGHLGDASTNRC